MFGKHVKGEDLFGSKVLSAKLIKVRFESKRDRNKFIESCSFSGFIFSSLVSLPFSSFSLQRFSFVSVTVWTLKGLSPCFTIDQLQRSS